MSEHPHEPDDLDAELDQVAAEGLRVETVDPTTGERRVEGLISREHLARAMVERDEPRG
jgi:hypothetical protein